MIYTLTHKVVGYLIRLEEFNRKLGLYAKLKSDSFLITASNFNADVWSMFALCIYLFNPFGLASCIGLSTIVVHNSILLLWLLLLIEGRFLPALAFLAVHANITVYSVVLIVVRFFCQIQGGKFFL